MKSYTLPYENEAVSRIDRGVYAFKLNFPTDLDLGLYSNISIERIKNNIRDSLTRFVGAHEPKSARGRLQTSTFGTHMRETYDATVVPTSVLKDLRSQLNEVLAPANDLDCIISISYSIRAAIEHLNPIYVGMCRGQSFYARLQNHLDGKTNLNHRLIARNLRWEDLSFRCFPLNIESQLDGRSIEKLIQMINLPICSEI